MSLNNMKILPTSTRNKIQALVEAGHTVRDIVSQTKVSHMTVQRIRANNYLGIQKPKAGRKEVLSSTSKRRVARISQVTDAENAPQIWQRLREETGIDVSHDTINRALKEVSLKASYKPKKPRLLPKYIKAHKEFAECYKNWTEDDWRHVIWSDETTVE